MTGSLRNTLQARADQLPGWDVDLEAVVRQGDRRSRRRRAAVAAGAAGVLVVAAGITALAGHNHPTSPPPAGQDAKPLSYAVGSIIHTGSESVDVGRKVASFVPTRWGFVFSTPDHALYREQDGHVRPVTTFDHRPSHLADASSPLVVSDDGMVVAWWDGAHLQTWPGYRQGMRPSFDTTDSFAGPGWRAQDPPRVEAVSDGHLWWWDGRDHRIAEVRPLTTTATWKDTNPPGSGTVVDAAGDQVLVRLRDGGMAVTRANLLPSNRSQQASWKPGGDLAGLTPQVTGTTDGDLAPDGKHWFTADGKGGDAFEVFDSGTDHAQTPHFDGGHVTPYAWLDNDTIAAWTQSPSAPAYNRSPVSLLTCHLSTRTCQVVARDIGRFGDIAIDGQEIR